MIPVLQQPSQPDKKLHLQEVSVAQCIGFSEVMPEHEETLITAFLNTIQLPEYYSDASTWTVADRYTAVFWYAMHTQADTYASVPYQCPHCQKEHHHTFDMRDIAAEYRSIQGASYREREFNGKTIQIHCLNGEDAEALQLMRLKRDEYAEDSPEYRAENAKIRVHEVIFRLILPNAQAADAKREESDRTEWVMGMPESQFKKLKALVDSCESEMMHGVPLALNNGKFSLKSPPHICPSGKGDASTRLHLPFRCVEFIPRI